MNIFKAHPSALSDLMSYPDKPALPEGAKTQAKLWASSNFFNRKTSFKSRYTDKGLQLEGEAFALLSALRGEMYFQNAETLDNEWFIGTPDHIGPLFDLKLPFSWVTFPLLETEAKKEYFWQLQAYMDLTGEMASELIYILMDTPDPLIKNEAYARARERKIEYSEDLFQEVKAELTYPELSPEQRVKIIKVERDDTAIAQARARVEAVREYLYQLGHHPETVNTTQFSYPTPKAKKGEKE